MVAVGQVFDRFQAFVDKLSGQQGKEIELQLEGRSTEIDKKVIDALSEPLVHLVRNAIDHGLETSNEREALGKHRQGKITLSAIHEGNSLVIEVRDDGFGVDIEGVKQAAISKGIISDAEASDLEQEQAVELLFHPGFSTAREVTEMSGRGVGLDAARSQVEMLGGSLTAQSTEGKGTLFRIRLPITMAILPALVVKCGEETYAIALEHIEQTLKSDESEITTVEGSEVLSYRNLALPIGRLRTILNISENNSPKDFYVVVVRGRNATAGIIVDQVLSSQDIVVKPLTGQLSRLSEYTGAAIAGDGSVFHALDVLSICRTALTDSSATKDGH